MLYDTKYSDSAFMMRAINRDSIFIQRKTIALNFRQLLDQTLRKVSVQAEEKLILLNLKS